jgi:hypothetical protein
MKIKVLLIAALMTAGAGINAIAKEDPQNVRLAVVPMKGTEVFKVIYKTEAPAKVKLNIYDASSQLVFSETFFNVDGFIRPLNFSGLKAGEYTIELTEGTIKKTEKVVYKPIGSVSSAKFVHVSKVGENDGRFVVSVANAGNEDITVRILDRYDNVIFTETRTISGEFAQVYRLKESEGVKFEISDASGVSKLSRF